MRLSRLMQYLEADLTVPSNWPQCRRMGTGATTGKPEAGLSCDRFRLRKRSLRDKRGGADFRFLDTV